MASHRDVDRDRDKSIEEFVGITGATPVIAEQTLEAMGWDVNAAVDLYMESDVVRGGGIPSERGLEYRVDEPDDDEVASGRQAEERLEQRPRVHIGPSLPMPIPFAGIFPLGGASFLSNPLADPFGFEARQPRSVRNIPITGDDDSNRAVGDVVIAELPGEEDNSKGVNHDEEGRSGGGRLQTITRRGEWSGSGIGRAEMDFKGGSFNSRLTSRGAGLGDTDMSGISADGRPADMLAHVDPDVLDTEEYMIRAALEESRKAALQAGGKEEDNGMGSFNNNNNNDENANSNSSNINNNNNSADEELERAMTLSLETAEQERRIREAMLHGEEDPPGLLRRTAHGEGTRRSSRVSDLTAALSAAEGPRTRSSTAERSSNHRLIGGSADSRRTRGRGAEPASSVGPVRSLGVSSSGVGQGGGNPTPGRKRGVSTRKSGGGSGRRGGGPAPDGDGEGGSREMEGIEVDAAGSCGPDSTLDGEAVRGRGGLGGRAMEGATGGDDSGSIGRRLESGAGPVARLEDDVMEEAANGNEEALGLSSAERAEAVMLESALFGVPYHGSGMEAENSGMRRLGHAPPTLVDSRNLRKEQDHAFLASLQADMEKEQRAKQQVEEKRRMEEEAAAAARAEEERKREDEKAKQQIAEELERELERKRLALPPEPKANDDSAICLMVRLPDGARRGRRFLRQDKLQALYDFIDVGGGVNPGSYRLAQSFPKRVIKDANSGMTLEEAGLSNKQEALFLELI